MADHDRPNDSFLLQRFNQRETEAIVSVYKLFFTELHLFASKLYQQSDTAPEDVVQDVFCSLLTNTEARFESMVKLKAFLFTALTDISVAMPFIRVSKEVDAVLVNLIGS